MHRTMCILTVIAYFLISSQGLAQKDNNNALTIEQAIKKGIENNLELQISLKQIAISKAEKIQSGLYPNPEFEIEAENILGQNQFSGFRGSEITASFSQNILLAGKLTKKEKILEMDITLSEWIYETKRLEVITSIRKSFAKALIFKKLVEKNYELLNISNELVLNLDKRVKAGKMSLAEVYRAKIILNNLQIEITSLKSEYSSTIFELSALINDPKLYIEQIIGELKTIDEVPSYDSLNAMLDNNPILKRFETVYNKQNAVILFEESKVTPDLKISAGYRRLSEIDANTFLIGASIPIPIFNRNEGAIQTVQIGLDKQKLEFQQTKKRLTLKLNLLYNRLIMLLENSGKIKNESIPDAEQAFRIIKEGNLVGRFTILDMLDAERTLFEIENKYLTIQGEINTLVVEIEGLTTKKFKLRN